MITLRSSHSQKAMATVSKTEEGDPGLSAAD
jgi:hypothetical protein